MTASAASCALALGAALYLARGVTQGEGALGIELATARLRATVGPWLHGAPAWLRDSGPDAAWSFALACALQLIAGSTRSTARATRWHLAGVALAVGYELGQGAGVVRGTFDPLDLLAIVAGYALGLSCSAPSALTSLRSLQRRITTLTFERTRS